MRLSRWPDIREREGSARCVRANERESDPKGWRDDEISRRIHGHAAGRSDGRRSRVESRSSTSVRPSINCLAGTLTLAGRHEIHDTDTQLFRTDRNLLAMRERSML